MVAFIVIGVHNWQTTAQGQPSGGSWRPASSSSHSEGRGGCWGAGQCWVGRGGGGGEEDWRCEKGPSPLICSLKLVSLLLLTPSPPKHTYTEKFYLYMDRHTQTEKHTQTAISKGFSPFIQNF